MGGNAETELGTRRAGTRDDRAELGIQHHREKTNKTKPVQKKGTWFLRFHAPTWARERHNKIGIPVLK